MEHRAISGMGPCGNDARGIMEQLYMLSGIDRRATVRQYLYALGLKAFSVL